MKLLGCPYPIKKHANGYLHSQTGVNQVKSDLLILLLTNPGERCMLPDFGTPLRRLLFEPNDVILAAQAKQMIIDSINKWEPRITVTQIEVTANFNNNDLNPNDLMQDVEHILGIKISFFDPENIQEIQELKLALPLSGIGA